MCVVLKKPTTQGAQKVLDVYLVKSEKQLYIPGIIHNNDIRKLGDDQMIIVYLRNIAHMCILIFGCN